MGRSSSPKQTKEDQIDIDKLQKSKEEPHLSGAYIRSLVKQLTSSRPKSISNPDANTNLSDGQDFPKYGGDYGGNQQEQPQAPPPPPPPQHKKQVRRRLHTSRPYQERLLNMAEARREIVTALKFHRAAMKEQQANEQPQPPQEAAAPPPPPPPQPMQSPLPPFEKMKSRRNNNNNNPRIYPSNRTNYSNCFDESSYFAPSFGYDPPNYPYLWNNGSSIPPIPTCDNFNLSLPNQTLGLNLNFQDFNNLDSSFYQNYNNSPTFFTSSSSSSSSPALSISTEDIHPLVEMELPNPGAPTGAEVAGGGLHPAMGDEEMAEIRSIGEQHEMEWNDTVNLVTSACWFKFLKAMEIGNDEVKAEEYGNNYLPFDEVMEFPSWLNSNESCLQTHFDDFCSEDYSQDPALPRMDIEEIEGMDGDWLS